VDFIRWNPDARILHGKCQVHGILFRVDGGRTGQFHVQHDFSRFGELDGVADEVDEHLAQARGIAHQFGRHSRRDPAGQLQLFFMGPDGHNVPGLLHQLSKVERNVLQMDMPGLHLGNIENVVDNVQKVFPGLPENLHEFLLFFVQRRLRQEVRHSQDGVQGGSDFVAHAGQEFGLRVAGHFRLLLGPGKRDFHLPALGDVAVNGLEAGHGSVGPADGTDGHFSQHDAAAFGDPCQFEIFYATSRFVDFAVFPFGQPGIAFVQEHVEFFPHQFVAAVSRFMHKGLVDKRDGPFQIDF